jgi:hypothetical protein
MKKFNFISVKSASDLINEQGGFPPGWNIDSLNDVHSIVSRILQENQDKIDGHWSITFAELCRIIHQERAQTKFEQDFAHYQKMKEATKK